MSLTTLVIIVLLFILFFGGGGYYWHSRRYTDWQRARAEVCGHVAGGGETMARTRGYPPEVQAAVLALYCIAATKPCADCDGIGTLPAMMHGPCQHCCGRGRVPRLSQEQMASVATRALTMDGGGS